jgi:hypothetical protein
MSVGVTQRGTVRGNGWAETGNKVRNAGFYSLIRGLPASGERLAALKVICSAIEVQNSVEVVRGRQPRTASKSSTEALVCKRRVISYTLGPSADSGPGETGGSPFAPNRIHYFSISPSSEHDLSSSHTTRANSLLPGTTRITTCNRPLHDTNPDRMSPQTAQLGLRNLTLQGLASITRKFLNHPILFSRPGLISTVPSIPNCRWTTEQPYWRCANNDTTRQYGRRTIGLPSFLAHQVHCTETMQKNRG